MVTDRFPSSPYGLTGCRASPEYYPACEYDILVGCEEHGEAETLYSPSYPVDLLPTVPAQLKSPSPPLLLALMELRPVYDPDWTLTSTANSAASREKDTVMEGYAEYAFLQSLSRVARCEASLSLEDVPTGSLWLRAAGYDFAKGMIASGGVVPRNAHLLDGLKRACAPHVTGVIETLYNAISLESATTTTVRRLVDGLRNVAHVSGQSKMSRVTLVEHRVSYLCRSYRIPDAYSYAQQEVLNALENLYWRICKRDEVPPRYEMILRELSGPNSPLHSLRKWKQSLNLDADKKTVEDKCGMLKHLTKEALRHGGKA